MRKRKKATNSKAHNIKDSAYFAAILSSAPEGIIAFDSDSKVVYVNSSAEKMLGVSTKKILGKKAEEEIDNEELVAALTYCELKKTGSEEDSPEVLDEVTLDDENRRTLRILTSKVQDEFGKQLGFVKTIYDITTEKEIDQMKSEFISTVSHELRTPLTSIKGYVDLILEGDAGEINDIQQEFLTIVKQNNDRLVGLINDLLDVSRIESGRIHFKIEPTQLKELVQNAIDTFRTLIDQKEMKLKVGMPKELPLVAADRDRIGQVIYNFLSNAIKYTPAGGNIAISVGKKDNVLETKVIDSGIGISAEDQKMLFTKFYRVDSSLTHEIGGSGLGLSICKTIVELHGGEVWIKSEVGKGSTFGFTLPLAAEVAEPAKEGEKMPVRRGGKILVIDKDPKAARLIQQYLEKEGYEVIKAFDGEEALKAAKEEKPALITLDIMLEGTDGFEVLEHIKSEPKTAKIPVVILSIVSDEHKGFRLGAADYLTKPINQDRLINTIKSLLGAAKMQKILIVDDDKNIVNLVGTALKKKGFEIAKAYNGLEAIVAVKKEDPDLIILDLRMPEMDGYQVIEKLKASKDTAHIPIIVMTAYHFDETKTDVLKLASEQLAKPFSVDSLTVKIEKMLTEK